MPAPLPDEKELIVRLSNGDEEAFEALYNYYQPKLYLYIYPFTKNSKEETEEVIQDIFVKLWIRRESLTVIENFSKYLFRMARNQFLDHLKKSRDYEGMLNGATQTLHQDEKAFRSPTHEAVIFNEYAATARKGIESLSPQRKRIFILRYENDLSLDEIAETLQIAKTTVKKQLYEAVNLVKAYMQEHGELPVILLLLFPNIVFHHTFTCCS